MERGTNPELGESVEGGTPAKEADTERQKHSDEALQRTKSVNCLLVGLSCVCPLASLTSRAWPLHVRSRHCRCVGRLSVVIGTGPAGSKSGGSYILV